MKGQNRSFGKCAFLGLNPFIGGFTLCCGREGFSIKDAFRGINGPIFGTVASWYLLCYLPKINRSFNKYLFINLLEPMGELMMFLLMIVNFGNVMPVINDLDGYHVLQHLGISEETINNHPTALGIPLIITTAASSALLVVLINKIAHISTKSVNWCINRTRKKSNIKTTENKRQLQGLKEIIQPDDAYKNKTGIIHQSTVLFS